MNEDARSISNALERIRYAERKAKDPEHQRELQRLKGQRRRAKHGDKLRAYERERYAKKRDEIRAHRAELYAKNVGGIRDKALLYQKLRYETGCMDVRLRAALAAAKSRAKERGLNFDLKLKDLGAPTHCAVTGIEFDMTKSFREGNIFVPSLDRIDPSLGYVRGNVRVVIHGYNLAKHTGTDGDVMRFAEALVARKNAGEI